MILASWMKKSGRLKAAILEFCNTEAAVGYMQHVLPFLRFAHSALLHLMGQLGFKRRDTSSSFCIAGVLPSIIAAKVHQQTAVLECRSSF
eukprot:3425043-Amphidinium_carterae.1